MPKEPRSSLPNLVGTRVLRLNPLIIGLSLGFISGAALMLATIGAAAQGRIGDRSAPGTAQ